MSETTRYLPYLITAHARDVCQNKAIVALDEQLQRNTAVLGAVLDIRLEGVHTALMPDQTEADDAIRNALDTTGNGHSLPNFFDDASYEAILDEPAFQKVMGDVNRLRHAPAEDARPANERMALIGLALMVERLQQFQAAA